eukprot:SAG22_NODE_982_length_6164_cov_32.072218_6_plen_201_part_00
MLPLSNKRSHLTHQCLAWRFPPPPQPDITVGASGGFDLKVPVGAFFTISTITTASKGINFDVPPSSIQFPLPYADNFETPGGTGVVGQEVRSKALPFCCASTVFLSKTVPFRAVCPARQAKYFADQIGAYEVHYEDEEAGSGNKVMRQMVPALVRKALSFCRASTVEQTFSSKQRVPCLAVPAAATGSRSAGRTTARTAR